MGLVQTSITHHAENLTWGFSTHTCRMQTSHCEMQFSFYQDILLRNEEQEEKPFGLIQCCPCGQGF